MIPKKGGERHKDLKDALLFLSSLAFFRGTHAALYRAPPPSIPQKKLEHGRKPTVAMGAATIPREHSAWLGRGVGLLLQDRASDAQRTRAHQRVKARTRAAGSRVRQVPLVLPLRRSSAQVCRRPPGVLARQPRKTKTTRAKLTLCKGCV